MLPETCASDMTRPMTCPACGFESPAGFRFCGGCGARLADASGSLPARSPGPTDAERRQITVVFCDVVGSTALSARLDPEELREVVRSYQGAAAAVIERYGGHVAQYLGDGILSYFGYPVAHEDDARRAVYAGMGVVDAVRELGRAPGRTLALAVRVGIHTGPVVAGEIGGGEHREWLALGLTPNIAARLQALAEPHEVVVSAATLGLTQGSFESEPLGFKNLQGVDDPVEVFRITQSLDVRSASEMAADRGLPPAVGRTQEIEQLVTAFHSAARSEGQVMLISGEAGIGKSRLVRMLRDRLAAEEHTWLIGRCSPYDQTSPWNPIVDLFQRIFEFRTDDAAEERLTRIEEGLRRLRIPLERSVPLYASWLGVPYGNPYSRLEMAPQKQRELLMESLVTAVLQLTEDRPVVLAIEDLHWSDPSSLELLQRLADKAPSARLLPVLTFRPTFDSPWNGAPHITHLSLERLPETDATELMTGVAGGRTLPTEVAQRIVEQAGGVPLFVEELTRAVLDSELLVEEEDGLKLTGSLSDLAIPATLQESLAARLDRLGPARSVAQLAAVLGREFTRDLVTAVAGDEEPDLDAGLDELLRSGLVTRRTEADRDSFVFKHALVREAAYESLLRARRQQLHRRVAEVLARDPEVAEGRPDLLGLHYAESGLVEPSVRAWLRAAELGMSRWASAEAIEHCTRGLDTLRGFPKGEEGDTLEISLQSALGQALTSAKGYAAPEVEITYARAVELCERLGDSVQLFWMLWALGGYYMVRGDLTLPIRTQMLRMAQTLGEPSIEVEGHFANGIIEFYLGGVDIACRDLDKAVELDTPGRTEPRKLIIGVDGGVTATCFGAMANWLAGKTARAAHLAEECEALGTRLDHVYSYAFALTHTSFFHQMRRDIVAASTRATEALSIAEEKGFAVFLPMCGFVLGWAQTYQDDNPEGGLELMRQCLDGWRGGGALIWQTYFLSHLADRHVALGRIQEADDLLNEALEAAAGTLERFWEVELRRLKGVVAAAQSDRGGAEAAYRDAVDLSRSRGVRSLEVRALLSLTRHLSVDGRTAEVQDMLEEALAGLEAGPPSPDITEGRSLLESLV